MSNSLKDEQTKLQVIHLDSIGKTEKEISNITGIPTSTIGDFLRKDTYKVWWIGYEESQTNLQQWEDEPKQIISKVVEKQYELIDEFRYPIVTGRGKVDDAKHFVIPDTQCKPDIDLGYLRRIGQYIVDRKPDVIIHLGDHADMPSLSSYDRGKKSAEGRRVAHDINSAIKGMEELLKPLWELQQYEFETYGEVHYKPRMVLCLGNHEERIVRHVNANPELDGFLGYSSLLYEEAGWEVYDFLEPVTVNGVVYCHYIPNPMTGKPRAGSALNIMKNFGQSFTVGHAQILDVATRTLPASGVQQWGIICGAAYEHDEDYKGHQGNKHWRGVIVKHNVSRGGYNPMFVELNQLKKKFGGL